MKALLSLIACCCIALATLSSVEAIAQTALRIQRTATQAIEISWPSSATLLALQISESLGSAADWKAVAALPTLNNGQYSQAPPVGSPALDRYYEATFRVEF